MQAQSVQDGARSAKKNLSALIISASNTCYSFASSPAPMEVCGHCWMGSFRRLMLSPLGSSGHCVVFYDLHLYISRGSISCQRGMPAKWLHFLLETLFLSHLLQYSLPPQQAGAQEENVWPRFCWARPSPFPVGRGRGVMGVSQ